MKDIPVKTLLTEGQYKAMTIVVEALGFTESGYLRHLIIQDMAAKEDLVCQMRRLTGTPGNGMKEASKRPKKV